MTPEQERAAARMRMRARAQQAARSRSTAPQGGAGATIGADVGRNAPNAAQIAEARRPAIRRALTNQIGGPMVRVTRPLANMIGDPDRRAGVGRAFQGLVRDVQAIPSLNAGQVARETGEAVQQGARDLPRTLGNIVTHLPQIARDMTYGQWEDEESNQRQLEIARIMGNQPQVEAAADRANANTANAGLNVAAPAAFLRPMSVARAAGTAAALDAPFALSRNSDQPLQERLPNALAEITGATAFGAGGQALANAGPAIQRLLPSRGARMVDRMDRAGASVDVTGAPQQPRGVTPDLATANEGRGVSAPLTNLTADNIFAGAPSRGRLRTSATELRDAVHDVRDAYGRARGREGAGLRVREGLENFAGDAGGTAAPGANPLHLSTREMGFGTKARLVFDQALRPIEANPATLDNTARALAELQQRADAPLVRGFRADPVLTSVEKLVRRLQRPASDSFEAASADDLAAMASEIASAHRTVASGEQSLASWTRRRGGIRDDRGDVRGMDPGGRGASAMISRNGRTLDDLAIAAHEEGFFSGPNPPTAREFMDALGADIRSPGARVRPSGADATNAREVLQYYEQQGIDTSLRGRALQRALRPLTGIDEGTGGRPPTLRDLRELRRKVREEQNRPRLGPDSVDNAALQRIEAALTRDIYDAAGPAADNLRAADRYYARGMRRIDGVRRFFNQENPADSMQQILRAANPRTENTRVLAGLRSALPDSEWRTIAASLIDEMGAPLPGAKGFVAEQGFSIERFATAYRAMTPRARRILFGSRGGQGGPVAQTMRTLADDLDNLAQIADAKKAVAAGANNSGSAVHLQNIASIGSVLSPANWAIAVPAILGGLLTGEMLTNPLFVRWLVSAQRRGGGPAGMRRQLAALRDLATRDPALVPVVEALEAQLQDQQYTPEPASSAGPASTQRQREPAFR